MKINLKVITFCLIAVLLVLSYRKALHAAKTVISQIYGIPSTLKSFNNLNTVRPPVIGTTYSITNLYTIIQAHSRSADFIVTNATGTIRVLGAANRVLGQNWQTKLQNSNTILLKQGDFINKNSIPSNATLRQLGNPPVSPTVRSFILWFITNYQRVTLYFNYPSDAKPTHRLYITDPNPGSIKIVGNQIIVPAYTNIVSKWNLN